MPSSRECDAVDQRSPSEAVAFNYKRTDVFMNVVGRRGNLALAKKPGAARRN
jgi:hypothetical protein